MLTGELTKATVEFTDAKWENGKASVQIKATEELKGYIIQYQIGSIEGEWIEIANEGRIGDLIHGNEVYGRLWDGANGTSPLSTKIEDKEGPVVEIETSELTSSSVILTVTAEDKKMGLAEEGTYEYYLNGGLKQTSTTNSYKYEGLTYGEEHTIEVKVKDAVGNVTKKSTTVRVTEVPSGKEEGVITFGNTTWSNGQASVTVSTNQEGYTLQWQKNGIEENGWTDVANGGTSYTITELNHNDEVYARLWDGTNGGEEASVKIEDKTNPSAPSIRIASGTAGTNGWYTSNVALTITAGTDEESGVDKTTYVITGAQATGETAGTSVTITAEGSSTITAYTYDKAGRKTASESVTINKDSQNPSAPSIRIASGTGGTNGWYRSNVALTITAGTDGTSQVDKTTYIITGAQATGETAGTNITITAEGSSTITAYTYDKAGRKTASTSVTINKDTVGPEFSGLNEKSATSNTAATFTDGVTVSDSTSGVASSTSFTYSPTTLSYGANNVIYEATDLAGNKTQVQRTITYTYVCFVAGTKVSTVEGLKNIEDLKVGELVYTYNEKTNEIEEKEILKTFINESNVITTITFENGEQIKNTIAHPYYVVGKGWKETKDLCVGDEILTQNQTKVRIIEIDTKVLEETIKVYNMNIADNHNYFVGEGKLLAHNAITDTGGCGLEDYPIE